MSGKSDEEGRTGRKRYSMVGYIFSAVIGAVILILCVYPVPRGVHNIGTVTGIVIGLLLLCFGLFPGWMHRGWNHLPRLIRIILTVIVIAAVVLAAVISIFMAISCGRTPGQSDTLIVLGCQVRGETPSLALQERIRAAAEYLKEHPGSSAVLSGGQGPGEKISEAECMRRGLIDAGIDESRLYPEDQSTTTVENLSFSSKIIEENGLDSNIAVCTNEYHILRAGMIVKKLGYTASSVPAHTALRIFLPAYFRELYAVLAQAAGIT